MPNIPTAWRVCERLIYTPTVRTILDVFNPTINIAIVRFFYGSTTYPFSLVCPHFNSVDGRITHAHIILTNEDGGRRATLNFLHFKRNTSLTLVENTTQVCEIGSTAPFIGEKNPEESRLAADRRILRLK